MTISPRYDVMATESARPGYISAVVLAAGAARRMGREKLLLPVEGQPLVRRVAREVVALGLSEILVVANDRNRPAVFAALSDLAVRVLTNERADEGIGTSIALAASSVAATSQALLLLQGDQPFVECGMLRTLIAEWTEGSFDFVASSFAGVVTTPVLFDRRLFEELRALQGDRGAKSVLDRHSSAGRVLEFPRWRGLDVDTPEDYRSVCQRSCSERRR
ncbi:MAG TPA: nucleotidyltransferase family protein [Candidatus Binatia bacterium]|nr:nucleotidyltransferase family protein [Candidatus Binatia bacterium]